MAKVLNDEEPLTMKEALVQLNVRPDAYGLIKESLTSLNKNETMQDVMLTRERVAHTLFNMTDVSQDGVID